MACRHGASTPLFGDKGSRYVVALVQSLAFGAIGVVTPSTAQAHFKINSPASWMSQDSLGGPQKNGPCAAEPNTALGDSAGTPTNTVTVLASGQTVPVSITATVSHPGWFRIALVEGASSTQTLATLPDPQAQTGTNCTPAIMKDPVWSPTQPVIADGLPAGSTATTQQSGSKTFQVTIPKSASCTSSQPCTLQVIMVMTDHPANDCYYHHCADISTASTTDAGSDSASRDASVARDASGGAQGASGAGGGGGSGGAGGGGGSVGGTGGGGGGGSGGATGSGGSSASGGVAGKGGSSGSGGLTGSGGSAGSGGSTGAGGNSGAGGLTGSGGSAGSGGSTGVGGSRGSGGLTGSGGSSGTGGLTSSGGSAGSGGSSGSTGTHAGAGTGAQAKPGSGGCDLSSGGGASWFMCAAVLGALAMLRRRRRRR